MSEQNNVLICRNGHRLPVSDSKFCIYCGVVLEKGQDANQKVQSQPVQPQNPAASPQQPNPASPVPPQSQTQQPVHPQNQMAQPVPPQVQTTPNPVNPQGQQQYQQPNPGNNPASPNHQNQQYQQQPGNYQNYQQYPSPVPYQQPISCRTCGGNPQNLDSKKLVCPECRRIKPLAEGYGIDASAFQWAADGRAMSTLRSITPLNAAAKKISEKVGRRWIESTFNSVLLSEKQLPHIYIHAVQAARILGMTHMPDIYLSGERPWDCLTFGTDNDSFIVIGSALAGNFRGIDMLFLMAREIGHCRAGHALWKTVIQFFLGEQGPKKGFMAGGIFNALSPSALIGGAIEMPLLGWARQAEITADRAGLLAVGNEEVARRVLLSWSLKSSFIYRQINVEAWLEQQSASEDDFTRLSELTTTSTPYITRRLKLMAEFAKTPELSRWRGLIDHYVKQSAPQPAQEQSKAGDSKDVLRVKCATCQTPMKIPVKVLEGKEELPVKCPNAKCGKITRLKKNAKPAEKAETAPKPANFEENMNYGD
ncbi:MAG: M48 family metalloprotease [Pyrinomonadaceae bacterium]